VALLGLAVAIIPLSRRSRKNNAYSELPCSPNLFLRGEWGLYAPPTSSTRARARGETSTKKTSGLWVRYIFSCNPTTAKRWKPQLASVSAASAGSVDTTSGSQGRHEKKQFGRRDKKMKNAVGIEVINVAN
jgi:hypothetical protein